MRRGLALLCACSLWPLLPLPWTALQAQSPPVAPKKPHVTEIHGGRLTDDYFWLREKENAEVLTYLAAEEAYANAMEADEAALRDTLYREMLGRIRETDDNVPYRRNGFLYYTRTEEGQQYPINARRRNMSSPEEVTLNLNVMAEGRSFLSLDAYEPSDDGHLLAYTLDTTGFRQYGLYIKNLETGAVSGPLAPRVTTVAWATDGRTLFYTQEDSVTKRSYRLYRHVLGSGTHDLLYEEGDELYGVYGYRSRSTSYLFLVIASATTSEMRFLPTDRPLDPLGLIAPRIEGQEYYVEHVGERFYIRTNDAGRTFRLMAASLVRM